jgi:hypothetical protein
MVDRKDLADLKLRYRLAIEEALAAPQYPLRKCYIESAEILAEWIAQLEAAQAEFDAPKFSDPLINHTD